VYLYGIAGACFAIGLKYAGMGIGIEDSEMNTILETLVGSLKVVIFEIFAKLK